MADDFAGSTATTGTVAVGGSRGGVIETAGDTDWFKIVLQAGFTYRFDMLGAPSSDGSLPDAFMRIRDSSGNSLAFDDDSGTGLNARISSFVAPYSGTYYISAGSSTASGTGTYRVAATQIAAPASTFTMTPVSTTVSEGVGSITFTITRSQSSGSETVFFSTVQDQGSTNNGDYTGIADRAVTFATGETSRTVTVSITNDVATEGTETYRAIIENASGTILDSSTFTITDNDAATPSTFTMTPVTTTVGESVGSITFTITRSSGNGSETVFFSTVQDQGSTNGGDYTGIADRAVIFASGETSRTVTVAITNDTLTEGIETFRAIIENASGTVLDSSTFTITDDDSVVLADDYAGNTATTGTIGVGSSRAGTIETAGDTDWFRITLQAGHTYRFDAQANASSNGSLADPFLRVRDLNGISIQSDDDSGVGFDARIDEFTAPSSGVYYLSIGSGASNSDIGTYRISATQTAEPAVTDDYAASLGTTGFVQIGSSTTGSIGNVGDTDWFKVNLTKGSTYQFDVEGSATNRGSLADPVLRIRDDNGNSLVFDDDSGTGANARTVFTAQIDGTYFISVGSFDTTAGIGTYRVSAQQTGSSSSPILDDYASSTQTTGRVTVNGQQTGIIESAGDTDWYAITLSLGSTYQFDVQANGAGQGTLLDSFLRLRDDSGRSLTFNDNSGPGADAQIRSFTAERSGIYYLSVGSSDPSTGTGNYVVRAFQTSSNIPTPPNTSPQITYLDRPIFLYPLREPVALNQYYGEAQNGVAGGTHGIGGTDKFGFDHFGLDFNAGLGLEVIAPSSGRIIDFQRDIPAGQAGPGGWGNFVTIETDNGLYISLMHLDGSSLLNLIKESRIEAGDRVGTVGNAGYGIHLHVQVGMSLNGPSGRAQYADGSLQGNLNTIPAYFRDFIGNVIIGRDGGGAITRGGGGDESYGAYGTAGDDTVIIGQNDAASFGFSGSDIFIIRGQRIYIDGGDGDDMVIFTDSLSRVIVDLQTGIGDGSANGGMFVAIENLVGSPFDDVILGSFGSNILKGGDGNDVLNGKAGDDQLYGNSGNDSFIVDSQADIVFEDMAQGTDSVAASVSHYLYANVENLTLTGTSSIFGIGNELSNILTGNAGENLLIAGAGIDTVSGGGARDTIFGEAGDDQLFGDAGVDYIVAGLGNDSVDGGVDADEIYGQDGDDALSGGASFHTDILVGGAGNDTIRGDSGLGDFDYLYGNAGNDRFYVDTPADLVFEQAGEGTDIVFANINGAGFYLYDHIENLTLLGNTPFGVGNALANVITGNAQGNFLLGGAGNDILNGVGGGDVLFGEAGADTFVFGLGTGGDVIGDFARGVDKIDLRAFGFASFAQLQTAFVQNGDVGAINLGNGDLVVLHNVTMSQLVAIDFIL